MSVAVFIALVAVTVRAQAQLPSQPGSAAQQAGQPGLAEDEEYYYDDTVDEAQPTSPSQPAPQPTPSPAPIRTPIVARPVSQPIARPQQPAVSLSRGRGTTPPTTPLPRRLPRPSLRPLTE